MYRAKRFPSGLPEASSSKRRDRRAESWPGIRRARIHHFVFSEPTQFAAPIRYLFFQTTIKQILIDKQRRKHGTWRCTSMRPMKEWKAHVLSMHQMRLRRGYCALPILVRALSGSQADMFRV
jgi:hypothetical protein